MDELHHVERFVVEVKSREPVDERSVARVLLDENGGDDGAAEVDVVHAGGEEARDFHIQVEAITADNGRHALASGSGVGLASALAMIGRKAMVVAEPLDITLYRDMGELADGEKAR